MPPHAEGEGHVVLNAPSLKAIDKPEALLGEGGGQLLNVTARMENLIEAVSNPFGLRLFRNQGVKMGGQAGNGRILEQNT